MPLNRRCLWNHIRSQSADDKLTIVIGRDARLSGSMIQNLVVNTLIGMGIDVINLIYPPHQL